MSIGAVGVIISVGGMTINQQIQLQGNHPNPFELPLPVAWAGTIATGVVTLGAGHAIVTGKVDVFWTDTGVQKCRYGCDAAVDGNEVTLTNGAGDTLPTGGAAVTVGQQTEFNVEITSSGLKILSMNSTKVAHVDLQQDGGTQVLPKLLAANQPWFWYDGQSADPLNADVGKLQASNGDATAAATLTILALENV